MIIVHKHQTEQGFFIKILFCNHTEDNTKSSYHYFYNLFYIYFIQLTLIKRNHSIRLDMVVLVFQAPYLFMVYQYSYLCIFTLTDGSYYTIFYIYVFFYIIYFWCLYFILFILTHWVLCTVLCIFLFFYIYFFIFAIIYILYYGSQIRNPNFPYISYQNNIFIFMFMEQVQVLVEVIKQFLVEQNMVINMLICSTCSSLRSMKKRLGMDNSSYSVYIFKKAPYGRRIIITDHINMNHILFGVLSYLILFFTTYILHFLSIDNGTLFVFLINLFLINVCVFVCISLNMDIFNHIIQKIVYMKVLAHCFEHLCCFHHCFFFSQSLRVGACVARGAHFTCPGLTGKFN